MVAILHCPCLLYTSCDGIMIRTYRQEEVEQLAEYSSIPVINGLTDYCHPCQILADLMTIREYKTTLEGLKLCFIGDANNMSNSLIVGCLKMGMKVAVATPEKYTYDQQILDFAKQYGENFLLTADPCLAAKDADVVETDVWASMGEEGEEMCIRDRLCFGLCGLCLSAYKLSCHHAGLPCVLPCSERLFGRR